MIGPTTPPRPPARLTPPRTIAATLCRVYGPGNGEPPAVLAVIARPPNAQNRPASAYAAILVRPTLTPLRNAASRLLPDGVEGQAEHGSPDGDPDDADDHDEDDERPREPWHEQVAH